MNIWDQLVDCICRPPRCVHTIRQPRACHHQQQIAELETCTRPHMEAAHCQGGVWCGRPVLSLHRDSYDPRELLGGAAQSFFVGHMECTRLDFELVSVVG